ncbi:MAG TPA: TonB family protein [Allosphingosinicella sp.]|nr:TonB family protein [Allosphingosinicella sp.]
MSTFAQQLTTTERVRAALPVAAIHILLALALIRGLASMPPAADEDRVKLIDLALPPPVPELIPPPAPSTGETESRRSGAPREEGAASPPNLESRATEIVAPPRPAASPLPAAAIAGAGAAPTQGAAPVRGPGTGSGGLGQGTGSGAGGDGPGGGGEGGYGDGRGLRPPRWLRGRLRDSDYPRGLGEAGVRGRVGVRYVVETDGRVTNCSVTRSSGSSVLDDTTCSLIEQRFRYDPARDRYGRPIRSNLIESYEWLVEDEPGEADEPPRRRRRLF